MKINYPVLIGCLLLANLAIAQRRVIYEIQEKDNSGPVILANFNYGFHWPGGDLADRFGFNYSVGGSLDLLEKHNFIIGAESFLYFGNNVNIDVLAPLRNNDGIILGDLGGLSEVQLRMRALHIGGHIGKIFRLYKNAPSHSGLRATLGGSYFQHKIKIQDDPVVIISALSDEYKKGYDRLSTGFALTEFIGYQHLSKNRLINFMLGVEFTQAFTQNRRSYNFDTRTTENGNRIDLLSGFRIGWTLPFYIRQNADELNY
ncbi:MAG: hypothetical protein H6577_20585 [Lewinellaceae bacterium]|nr:hypothetical protein [Saprospiraceae bacterium]MCB9340528.1 hypothetical protein [Lewinellaceae bacterium]